MFVIFSCGTCVIVVLNSDIVVFRNIQNFYVIGSTIFSMVVSNFSIFLCCVMVFGRPPSRSSIFFFAHAYISPTRPALIV